MEVLDVPSAAGNVDLRVARVNRITKLQAYVLLPDGYDEQPERRWPVYYLLHGVGDGAGQWLDRRKGDARVRAAGFPGIVVMPEGGRGYYTDAWLGGARRGVNWERYLLDEVVPAIEQRYRILPGREHHAIGGLSMGGYGATLLGAQLPSYFGTVVSYSGLFNIEDPQAETSVPFFSRFSYTRQWGRFRGPYVRAHNPIRLLDNLAGSRLYVSMGNGIAAQDLPFDLLAQLLGGPTEALGRLDAERFVTAARGVGSMSPTARTPPACTPGRTGGASCRRRSGGACSASQPAAAPAQRTAFTYRTMAPHGNAWGLGFRFAELPNDVMTLTRDGQRVAATGRGTITITPGAADHDATGAGTRTDCAFTAELPFERELPAGC